MSKISKLHNSLREALKKQQAYLSPPEIDELIDRAQMDHFGKLLGNTEEYQPGRPVPVAGGLAKTQRIIDGLQSFYKTVPLTIGQNGTAAPPDYQAWVSAHTSPDSGLVRPIEVKDRSEWASALSRVTAPPTARCPIACISGKTIIVAPAEANKITLTYIRRPVAPKLGYSLDSKGRAVHVPDSDVEIEWSDLEVQQIFHSALAYAATIVEDAGMAGLSAALKARGE